jgi:glycosyltransferase involved in cell wall biosynthesis
MAIRCQVVLEPTSPSSLPKRSMAEYMAKLYENEYLLAEMGKKTRKKVIENYSIKNMISSYRELYKEVLNRK